MQLYRNPTSIMAAIVASNFAVAARPTVARKLSSKKAKYFFKRYLQYASDAGDAALVEKVKAMARAWVERATEA